jgi:hypothetical protein
MFIAVSKHSLVGLKLRPNAAPHSERRRAVITQSGIIITLFSPASCCAPFSLGLRDLTAMLARLKNRSFSDAWVLWQGLLDRPHRLCPDNPNRKQILQRAADDSLQSLSFLCGLASPRLHQRDLPILGYLRRISVDTKGKAALRSSHQMGKSAQDCLPQACRAQQPQFKKTVSRAATQQAAASPSCSF